METLTIKQAYAAMFYFLEQFYTRTKSDDIGGLLGAMSLLDDGLPADRALVADWQEAVQFAMKGGGAPSLTLK